jgi:hypothetical protein
MAMRSGLVRSVAVARGRALLAVVLAGALAACTGTKPTEVDRSPVEGLAQGAVTDSAGAAPPPATSPTPTSGYFRGTVLGHQPSAGADTLSAFPRLANVEVTAYAKLSGSTVPTLGPAAATVVTNASGVFQLPLLPGGEYVVTFRPPSTSPYQGQWATAIAHAGSGEHAWWVVLTPR